MSRRWIPMVLVANAVVFVAAVASAVVGIGPAEFQVSTADLASAAESTMAESARFEYSMEMTGLPGLDEPITMVGEGAGSGSRVEMSMDMRSMLDQMEAAVGEPAPPEIREAFAEPMRMVVDGSTMYMCGSVLRLELGAECGSIDFADFGDELGELMGGQPVAQQDSMLGPLLGARSVEELGREDVRGVSTRHLRAIVRMRDAFEEADPELETEMRRMYEQLGLGDDAFDRLLDAEMPIEAWVGNDGLVRRVTQVLDESFWSVMADAAPEMGDVSATMTMEYFDFGAPIEIQVPDHAIDLSELLTGA